MSPVLRTALVLRRQAFYEHSGWTGAPAGGAAGATWWNQRTRGRQHHHHATGRPARWDWRRVARVGDPWCKNWADRGRPGVGPALAQRPDPEAYLNPVPFRGELVGIDALSRTLFGSGRPWPGRREAAVAAALVRAPTPGPRWWRSAPAGCCGHAAAPIKRQWTAMRWTVSPAPHCSGARSMPARAWRRTLRAGAAPAVQDGAAVPDPACTTLRAPLQRALPYKACSSTCGTARAECGRRRRAGAGQRHGCCVGGVVQAH